MVTGLAGSMLAEDLDLHLVESYMCVSRPSGWAGLVQGRASGLLGCGGLVQVRAGLSGSAGLVAGQAGAFGVAFGGAGWLGGRLGCSGAASARFLAAVSEGVRLPAVA